MIDFSTSSEDQLLLDNVRRFVAKEVIPLEAELLRRGMEGGDEFLTFAEMQALQLKAKRAGLWGLDTPVEYGGMGLSPVQQAGVWQEVGSTFVPFKFGGSAANIMYLLAEDQKREYLYPTLEGLRHGCFALSEPGAGSDAHAIRTTAVREGKDWRINGEKTWISWALFADYALVFARTPEEGDPNGITLFLVDRAMGYEIAPIHLMGNHRPASLFFNNVRVPGCNVVGEVNKGFHLAMRFIHQSRAWILPSKNVGAATRLLEMALSYADMRSTFGKKLAERENIQWMIAESEVEIRCAKLLVLHAAWRGEQAMDYRHEACVSKLYAAQMANRVVDRVMQIHGASGYAKLTGIERWFRDLRVQRIYEGPDEIQLASIFRNLSNGTIPVGRLA